MSTGQVPAAISMSIQAGQQYLVGGLGDARYLIPCRCMAIDQRNWSRVGPGQVDTPEGRTENVFLKQNIGKNGEAFRDQWEYENLGVSVACELLQDIVRIPRMMYHNPSMVLSVFEFIDVIPFDTLLRNDKNLFMQCFLPFIARSVQILRAMQYGQPGALADKLPVKKRPYGGEDSSINFKGFDIRNIGVLNPASENFEYDQYVMFDFGRPYRAPIEEAAAKLFISIGLLNWGRPMARFAKGPDTELLALTLPYLKPFLEIRSIEAELGLQSKFRASEVHGSGILEKTLKTAGINIVGKHYLNKLKRWCRDNIPMAPP